MRGKGPLVEENAILGRITPAYAGKSLMIVSPFGKL